MDFRHMLGASGPIGAQQLSRDAQLLELQEIRRRRREVAEKLNKNIAKLDELEKREEQLLEQLLRPSAYQEASSSKQYMVQPHCSSSVLTERSAAVSWPQVLSGGSGNVFGIENGLGLGLHRGGLHEAPTTAVPCSDIVTDIKDVLSSNIVSTVDSEPRKRALASVDLNVEGHAKKKKLNGISFEELRGHITNFSSFGDETTGNFKCPVCERAKKEPKSKSIRHLLEHLGDKEYHAHKCPVEGCDVTSVRSDVIHTHVVNMHKLQWTEELKAASINTEKKAILDALVKERK
ncbi:hypothetical protein AAVH_08932 [Aphelenchoides avenae]|nr:hypothetical protein AAVH_08932 [Aphelenchus avenae]